MRAENAISAVGGALKFIKRKCKNGVLRARRWSWAHPTVARRAASLHQLCKQVGQKNPCSISSGELWSRDRDHGPAVLTPCF